MHIQYRGYDLYYCHYKESRALPSVKCFAESQKSDTRQRASLPSAALGKARLSAKSSLFAECQTLGTARHSAQMVFAECRTLGKAWHSVKADGRAHR
jgi:hypothetical protein